MNALEITILSTIVAAVITFCTSTALEYVKSRNARKLDSQKRIWDLKAPLYIQLSEELEDLFTATLTRDFDVIEFQPTLSRPYGEEI